MIVDENDDIDDLIDILEEVNKYEIKAYQYDILNNHIIFTIKKLTYHIKVDVEEIDVDSFIKIDRKNIKPLIVSYFQSWIKRKQILLINNFKQDT